MTLIVALEGQDGLVLAADSRGTIGDPRSLTAVNDLQKKLFKLSDHCGITISGSSELATQLIGILQDAMAKKKVTNVDDVTKEAINAIQTEFFKWFGKRPWASPQPILDQRPSLVFLIAGYNMTGQNPTSKIFLINSALDFAPQLCSTGFMVAGIPQYAIYLIHRLYDRQMNLKSLQALAAHLITETASQDPKVGGPVRMAHITPGEGYRELNEKSIEQILATNQKQNQEMRRFFIKGVSQ